MGSLITLGLGQLEIDWGKNFHSRNHSKLFLPSDLSDVTYFYFDDHEQKTVKETLPGYSTKLINVKRRLELLGYTLPNIEFMFNSQKDEYPLYYPELELEFKDLLSVFGQLNISKYKSRFGYPDYELGEFANKGILSNPLFKNLKRKDKDWNIGDFLENLDPYIILRLCLMNSQNEDLLLEWRTHDYIEGGWATEESIFSGLEETDKYLVVTEGSSDSFIIKESIQKLAPDISDFFYFIDMEENYPFTGSGNLLNFCKGLQKIKIQNKTLVIFDNDAEGIEKFIQAKKLPLPDNMRVMHLPSLEEFKSFPTIGPSGESLSDINGQAVAIELFLDLKHNNIDSSKVRWTSYKKDLNCYQGALENKDDYLRRFKNARPSITYDYSKLLILVKCIYNACI